MMVQSPKSLCPTNSSLLLTPIFQQIVPLQCPRPCPSILFKSGHKKLKLDDSVALSDGFCFNLTCAESSEEERGGGGGSPSRRSRQKDLDEAEEGGAVASGAASSSPSQEEEEEQQQQPPSLRRGSGGRRRGGAPSEGKHPVFRGVRMRQWGRWVSEIRVPGKKSRIWLGTFPAPEMAARAYDTAAFNLKRSYAYLNFPESASSLPLLPPSSTAKQIQEAASTAAAAFASITLSAGEGGGHVRTSQQQDLAASSALPPAESFTSMCTSESMQEQELSISPQTASSYIDEDIMFDMPNVLTDMAEGLMITPPLLNHGNLNGSNGDNDVEAPSLWDH